MSLTVLVAVWLCQNLIPQEPAGIKAGSKHRLNEKTL